MRTYSVHNCELIFASMGVLLCRCGSGGTVQQQEVGASKSWLDRAHGAQCVILGYSFYGAAARQLIASAGQREALFPWAQCAVEMR